MHELSLALSLVDVASAEAARWDGARVLAIHLKVGVLCGVIPEALRSAFEIARVGSCLANAQLAIEEVPATAYCPTCAAENEVLSVQQTCCRACGTPMSQVLRGRELEIIAFEIES